MPEPARNVPGELSLRTYSLSTCPEPDEPQGPQSTTQIAGPPQLPSSWPRDLPSLHPSEIEHQRTVPWMAMEGNLAQLPYDASETSSRPHLSRSHNLDEDLGQLSQPGSTESSITRDDSEEAHRELECNIAEGLFASRRAELEKASRSRQILSKHPFTPRTRKEAEHLNVASGPVWSAEDALGGMGDEYAQARVTQNCPSSFLRPGSRFIGTQQSERQQYDVQVEIKHVDLSESFLCGYLRIQGLTDDHPTLTTYFEGEIIGPNYGFITQHPGWGATEKIDMSHWSKFNAFRPFAKQARRNGSMTMAEVAQRENIFMRWKEHFLVPDHRVKTINGASFEGFYYICFNQMNGEINGIYFHSKSERFQQLDLKHVQDKGCLGAVEFR